MHKKPFFICYVLCTICYVLFLSSCATTPELPPPPPKYVYEEKAVPPSLNSLWYDRASLYEDVKAQRLNDLVTIRVIESISGSGKADTNASRESSLEAEVTDVFGIPLDFNRSNLWGKGNTFSPTASGSMQSEFKGSGETTREGKIIGTITAKVVEVLPNGNLVLESRKEITINREKQFFVLRGVVRPYDIAPDNTILSSKVADAQVYFVGKGVVQDKQGPGWLVQILDKVWPF
ncbi:MAG: flagellar basal body L-ring protein FlgH [Thermodesulfovibrionales bacterium]